MIGALHQLFAFMLLAAIAGTAQTDAAESVPCGRFSGEELPAPTASAYPTARERAKSIDRAVKTMRYPILFFGDSLTEGWDPMVWDRSLGPRGALNAGVSGDRTDHLLWRLQNGNLDGTPPEAVVLLIGTNDLAYGRTPELTADGIRAALEALRQYFPTSKILLLGLLPREELPSARLRLAAAQVNRLIRACADGWHIFYADIGDVLLDSDGHLAAAISPDTLHLTTHGYALLASRLDPELDRMLAAAR